MEDRKSKIQDLAFSGRRLAFDKLLGQLGVTGQLEQLILRASVISSLE
jgi:hypothetical protein